MDEKLYELLNESKIEEAYKLAKSQYEQTNDLEALFYWVTLDIDFYHNIDPLTSYELLKKTKKALPRNRLRQYNYFMSIITFHLGKYEETIVHTADVLELKESFPYICFIRGVSMLNLDYPYNEWQKCFDEAIEFSDGDQEIVYGVISEKIEYCLNNSLFDIAKEELNNNYLKIEKQSDRDVIELKIALAEGDLETSLKLKEKVLLDPEFDPETIYYAVIVLADKKGNYAAVGTLYQEMIEKKIEITDSIKRVLCRMDLMQGKDPENNIAILTKAIENPHNDDSHDSINAIRRYYISHNLRTERAAFEKKLEETYRIYNNARDYLIATSNYNDFKMVAPQWMLTYIENFVRHLNLKTIHESDFDDVCQLLVNNFIHHGKKDKATLYSKLRPFSLSKIIDVSLEEFIPKFKKDIDKAVDQLKGVWGDRVRANILFHGLLGYNIDEENAKVYAKKAYDASPDSPCAISIYATTLLESDKEEAFRLFTKGAIQRKNDITVCSCCVPFYIYCLYQGYGTKADKNKAYQYLIDFVQEERTFATTNTMNLYAWMSLEMNNVLHLNKSYLNDVYQLLNTNCEHQIEATKHYYLMELAKILGYKYRNHEKAFKKHLAKSSEREKNHYLMTPSTPYLSNI